VKGFPNVIVIGASDGGVEALASIVRRLPSGFAAPIVAALHIDPRRFGRLPSIIGRGARIPVKAAEDRARMQAGTLYLAPPQHQIVLSEDSIYLSTTAMRHGFHRVVDPLFGSAAQVFGERAIGVILTGMSHDGAIGLQTIKREGGITIVHDPSDAAFPQMPKEALQADGIDYKVPAQEIGALLAVLVHDAQILRRTA
jgi:two-component system chemotaxis response regulator CheB